MIDYAGSDIYCDLIIPKNMPVKIVKETDTVLAYYHTKPSYDVHIVVTPKKHISSLLTLPKENDGIAKDLLNVLCEVADKVKNETGACRVITNLGDYQDSKHLHFHVTSGKPNN